MTRKDYEMVAEVVRERLHHVIHSADIGPVARELAVAFAEDNPRFDAEHFYRRCGL